MGLEWENFCFLIKGMKEATRGGGGDLKDQRFPVSLRGCWFGLNRNFRDLLAHQSITPVQYTTLRNICEFEGPNLNQKKLSSLLSSNQNNLTAILAKLEAQGLIDRRQGKIDGRSKEIEVTPLGTEVFQETQEIALELQSEVMEVFSKKEANRLFDYLRKCSDQLDLIQ
jgi:DNA-binding MarR family transcriptional regulator